MPAYGDLVILTSPRGKNHLRRLEPNNDMHSTEGILRMEDLVQAEFGSEICTLKGIPYRMKRPTLHDLVRGVRRQTQILYSKDIGYICMRLGVGNSTRVIEAGSGSGSLTVALSWLSGEKGHVYTYEARPEFYELCKRNLKWAGVGHNVTQYNRDIAEGFEDHQADALFLDVRTPWEYLDKIVTATRPGAVFAFLVPTVDQVSQLLRGLEKGPFDDVEVEEILIRRWKPIADRLRPEDRMIAHTGFLIFAKHQNRSEEFEALKPRGTRERKQEAARQKRLAEGNSEEVENINEEGVE